MLESALARMVRLMPTWIPISIAAAVAVMALSNKMLGGIRERRERDVTWRAEVDADRKFLKRSIREIREDVKEVLGLLLERKRK